jgi:hypothetical protein
MYSTLFRIIYIFSTYKLNYLFLKFQIFYEEKYLDRIFQIKEKIVVLAIVPSYHLIGLCSYFSPWIISFDPRTNLLGCIIISSFQVISLRPWQVGLLFDLLHEKFGYSYLIYLVLDIYSVSII